MQKITRVLFVVDRSGSMRPIMRNAVDALNDNIRTIREQSKQEGQGATVSLVVFDDKIDLLFFNQPVDSVKEISYDQITARGQTALFDAVGSGIQQLESLPAGSEEDISFLVLALTDGAENYSQNFSSTTLNKLMTRVQSTDRWTLSFLVPRGSRRTLINEFGIPDGNVLEWDTSAAGVKKYADANRAGLNNYFKERSAGKTAVKSFYTDLTNVSVADVKQLDNLSGRVTILDVDKDAEIRPFVESKGFTFQKGAAFYQLIAGKSDADKVQDYKRVLIMEKGNSTVYGGDDARRLLGLPDTETKIRPGQHGKFDVFIQSASTNRKLKKGTRLIYYPGAAL